MGLDHWTTEGEYLFEDKKNSNEKISSNDMEFKSEIPSPALLKQIFQHSIFTDVTGHHHHSALISVCS